MTRNSTSKQPENRHHRPPAAAQPNTRHRAIERPAPPERTQDKDEKRLQGKPAERTEHHSETDPNIVRATDGSNTALQFSGKRMRHVHIDPNTGAVTPIRDWQPVDLRKITRWVIATTPGAPMSEDTFTQLGAAL